jgi:hypothetical protein
MLKRMIVKRLMYRLAVAAMLVVPVSAMAQTSSINAFSPYSMYGIGELQTPGVVAQRSMGGVGLGMRSSVMVNPLNPAAYSLTPRQGFLFDFGVEGVNFYNRQQKYADGAQTTSRTSYNTFNFHDIAFQLPLARRLGLGFSLTPYSSVGYRVSADEQSDDVWGNIGRVQYLYAGEGWASAGRWSSAFRSASPPNTIGATSSGRIRRWSRTTSSTAVRSIR